MDAIEAAGKKASSLTRKTQQRLLSERNSLLKNMVWKIKIRIFL